MEKLCKFIDSIVTTDSKTKGCEYLIDLQRHRHTKSCMRQINDGKPFCRFHIPFPPLSYTQILKPLDISEMLKEELKTCKSNFEIVKTFLNEPKNIVDISFEEILSTINLSFSDYINALRFPLKQNKIILKRNLIDVYVNAFNSNILQLHRANMDIQFVLDPYAACSYINQYINKSLRGLSLILRDAMKEIISGNSGILQQLRIIGNNFISASEISAQEAVWALLGIWLIVVMPMFI